MKPSGTDLQTLNFWINEGKLRPVIDRVYPLSAAKEAHSYSETKRVRGKLVLIVNQNLMPLADAAKIATQFSLD